MWFLFPKQWPWSCRSWAALSQPFYKSVTISYSCSFRKAFPVINFEETLKHALFTVPLILLNASGSVVRQVKTDWLRHLCRSQMTRIQMLQKKTKRMLLISWHWCEWWRRFKKPLKILHSSWYRFYLTKEYLQVDLVADCYFKNPITDCYFKNLITAAEKVERDSATKIIIKSPKSKVPSDYSNCLSNGENNNWLALSNN